MQRAFKRKISRLVVKIGSSLVAAHLTKPKGSVLSSLLTEICQLQKDEVQVILVSSGAIVSGMKEMKLRNRPADLASLQALAAIGQAVLMKTYGEFFANKKSHCAQVLLTWDDFDNRVRYNSARLTFQSILNQRVCPIVNENDTIATDEIKFGDNDRLSALVASLVQADLLAILTDVEGLYDLREGKKKIFDEVKEITREIEGLAGGTRHKNVSRGGMITKIDAVKIATHANIPCVIAKSDVENILHRIVAGERIGTFFVEKEDKLLARKHWISFGAKPKGMIIIDDGARDALLKGGRSLLLPGILSWEGHFKVDDVVVIADCQRQEIARGVSNYSIGDLHKIKEKKGQQEVIHYDQLVLCQR